MSSSSERTGEMAAPPPDHPRSAVAPHVGLTGRVLGRFGDWLDRLPKWLVVASCLIIIAGVAAADFATGSEVNVSIFYIGPVVLATWLASAGAGLAVSGACAAFWSVVELLTQPELNRWVYLWNVVVLVAFLLLTVFLVTLAKRAIAAEHDASRTDSLTGVANGRAFEDRAALAISAMRRTRLPITFCYLDLDHFKRGERHAGASRG